MSKRILFASDTFFPRWDGITRFLEEMIPRLKKRYEVTVIAPDYGPIPKQEGYELIRFGIAGLQLGDYYPAKVSLPVLEREIKKTDVVFVQAMGSVGILSMIYAKRHRKKIVYYMHIIEWETFPKSVGKSIFKNVVHVACLGLSKVLYNMCDVIIVPSVEMMEILTWRNITPKKKIVHLGIDTSNFRPPASKRAAKEALGIKPDDFVIGYVGRLAYEKDLKTLYRAFNRFASVHKDSKLLLVGKGRPEIERVFAHKRNIILAGAQNNVVPYYQAMDVHVLTSLTETTSLSTLEAMACGLPVVATPVGYIGEYIHDKQNGVLIKKKDPFGLYRKLEMLKASDKLREELSAKARETVVEKFSWEKTADEISEIFDSLK